MASIPAMAVAGAAAGALGGLAGAYLLSISSDELTYWMIGGAVLSESLSLPLGVHLANRQRGDYFPSALASSVVGALAFITLRNGGDWGIPEGALIVFPLLQVTASIAIERATSR